MQGKTARTVISATFLAAGLALSVSNAAAQSVKSVAGTYTPVSVPAFGDNPRGSMILAANGQYSIVIARATMAKIAGGARNKGTPDENKAIVDGSIAHVGKFTIDDKGKSISFHIATSTFPNWDGTTQKRALKVKGDTLTYTVTAPSNGGAPNDVVWKRVK